MKWLDLRIGGQRWAVHLVSPKSKYLVDDEGVHVGRCVYEKCRIYVSSALDPEARDDTLLHELLHALLFVTGAEKVYGGNARAEERLVSALTPTMHRLLSDLGFRFPRGFTQ